MTDIDSAPPAGAEEHDRGRLELAAAVLLGLAALAAAFTAYQSGKAGGEATDAANAANAALVDANFFYNQGNQQRATDTALFLTLVEAEQRGDETLAGYVEESLMSDNLAEAVEFWRTSDAETPFDDVEGNPYVTEDYDEGARLQTVSEEALADVEDAGAKGDAYDLAGVLLAVALFIGGIGTLFSKPLLSWWLLAVGTVALVAGATVAVAA